MTIQQFARKYHVSKDTLRYYEKMGLIHPSHKENGYRNYDEACGHDMEMILVLKQLDFSLEDIKTLLSLENQMPSQKCNEVSTQIFLRKIEQISQKISFLHMAKETLKEANDLMANHIIKGILVIGSKNELNQFQNHVY